MVREREYTNEIEIIRRKERWELNTWNTGLKKGRNGERKKARKKD